MASGSGVDGLPVERLSFNQITADPYDLRAVVDACVRHGVPGISVWRHKLADMDIGDAARLIRSAGLAVSSLCRGGFFAAATPEERQVRHEDNLRAMRDAAELGTDVLVLVCGPAPDRDIDLARRQVVEGIEAMLPTAERLGIRLGIEPLHPVFAGERSVIVTLDQAVDTAERFPADRVGVIVDVYHVWWDPRLYAAIERASGRILGHHTCDWLVPLPDPLMGRGLMGDGVIELRRIRRAVEAAGYDGLIEVEIFNREVWARDLDDIVSSVRTRFLEHV